VQPAAQMEERLAVGEPDHLVTVTTVDEAAGVERPENVGDQTLAHVAGVEAIRDEEVDIAPLDHDRDLGRKSAIILPHHQGT
jgi:hypothetical protein